MHQVKTRDPHELSAFHVVTSLEDVLIIRRPLLFRVLRQKRARILRTDHVHIGVSHPASNPTDSTYCWLLWRGNEVPYTAPQRVYMYIYIYTYIHIYIYVPLKGYIYI